MKAYDMSMALIFINAGVAIMASIDVFGSDFAAHSGIFSSLYWLMNPIFTIPGIGLDVTGIMALAVLFGLATIIVLNTNVVTDRGIAYGVFALIFWGSFVTTAVIISAMNFPGIELFYSIFFIAAVLLFIMTLVQMPTGGQKAYV